MSLEGHLLGHYRLLHLIGSGGMGEIYLAEDTHIPRQVAVKVLRTEQDFSADHSTAQEAKRLFDREMKAISLLDHPHILPIFDYGTEQIGAIAPTYLVMPYRPEGSLLDWLRKQESNIPLDPAKVVQILLQAADALQHAHERQILHQDIKPSNFLIRIRNSAADVPDVLLADFGIAKFLDGTSSSTQSVRGTPSYMPPEQWEGRPVPASDQYSLAIMAFYLLTGQLPFQGSPGQVMRQHYSASPPAPSSLNPRLSPQVDVVLLRALAKQPEERFSSVLQFAQVLQQTVLYNAPSASSLPPVQRTPPPEGFLAAASLASLAPSRSRFSRSQKLLLIAIAIVVILGSSGIVFYALGLWPTRTAARGGNALAMARFAHTRETATARAAVIAATQMSQNATATAIANDPYLTGKGTLVLSDPLSEPGYWLPQAASGWGGACAFSNGVYHLTQTVVNRTFGCNLQSSMQMRNFIYEVQMTVVKGNCGGLRFRYNPNQHAGYMLRLCAGGTIVLSTSPKYTVLLLRNSPLVRRGYNRSNILAVSVIGNRLTVYINKHIVGSCIDTNNTFSIGTFAFDVQASSQPTDIAFSNVKIWQL